MTEAGAVPDVYLVPPNNERGRVWSAAVARTGSPEQLAKIPEWHRARYEDMTKYVEVLGGDEGGVVLVSGVGACPEPLVDRLVV